MGKNGGYILDTGIQIIPDVPIENIVALIDEVKN
jgi:uroporphyrinogen-III decarboxylase